jgi:hypothetical protein
MECCSTIKNNDILLFATTEMQLDNVMLRESSQDNNTHSHSFKETSKLILSICRMVLWSLDMGSAKDKGRVNKLRGLGT